MSLCISALAILFSSGFAETASQPTSMPVILRTLDVLSFGAIPDDGKDDTAALASAFEACRKQPGSRLILHKGRYDLGQAPSAANVLFSINALRNTTIDGQGAELLIHRWCGVFAFHAAQNLCIQNLTIDYERAPFSVGHVLRADATSFDLRIQDSDPILKAEPVIAFMSYDLQTGLPAARGLDVYNAVTQTELIGPQTLRCRTSQDVGVRGGMDLVVRHQVYGRNAFVFAEGREITLRDVTIYTAPGMGMVAHRCHDVNVERCRVMPRPGSSRLISTTADALHFGACTGTVSITSSVFDGMGDDAVNIKAGLYVKVSQKLDDHTILGAHPLGIPSLPLPGESMEFIRTETLLPYATARVTSAALESDGKTHRIVFDSPLPAEMQIGDVLGNATTTPRVRISNCTVRRNRARGFLIQTRDVVVENCTMQDCTSGGIYVFTETVYFYEAIGTRDVTLRNNTFTHCNYTGPLGEGVIMVSAYGPNAVLPSRPGVHKRILLEGNTIRTADNAGIFVAGADTITIRDNTIEDVARNPTRQECHAAIYVMSSQNVTIANNKADPARQGSACDRVFETGPGCDREAIKLSGNQGF